MTETRILSPIATDVLLVGGPDDWHLRTLTQMTPEELAGPREELGVQMVSTRVPHDHPDRGARAFYEPAREPAPVNIWFFRGWVPWSGWDAETRRATEHQAVDVAVDDHGIPTHWTDEHDDRHFVDRTLVYWDATGESDLGFDVWHVRSHDGDWELRAHPGHWEAGRLPDIEDQEHDELIS